MEYYLAVYSSITLANRVKKNILPDGDYIGVIHAPKNITKGGCSYALRFKKSKLSTIKNLSRDLGINIKGIFKERVIDGKKEYLKIE